MCIPAISIRWSIPTQTGKPDELAERQLTAGYAKLLNTNKKEV